MVDVARVASMNPDNMLAAGLKSDFDGLITKVRLCPWDYDGKLDHHVLAVARPCERPLLVAVAAGQALG